MMKRKICFVMLVLYVLSAGQASAQAGRSSYSLIRGEWESPDMRPDAGAPASGQSALHGSLNLPRPGDRLLRQQVNLTNPGGKGENVTWDFSRAEVIDREHEVSYVTYPDAPVAELSGGSIRQYAVAGDSLLAWGYENPSVVIRYDKPETVMTFPLTYGNESADYYYGRGLYCDRNNIGAYLDGSDTTFIRTETYRWYAPSSRYPVLGITGSWWEVKGKVTGILHESYAFHPADQQDELPEDPANEAVLAGIKTSEANRSTPLPPLVLSENARIFPNPVTTSLQVALSLPHPADIRYSLYDTTGKQLYSFRKAAGPGETAETIDMSAMQRGIYLLRVEAGNDTVNKKIVKQ